MKTGSEASVRPAKAGNKEANREGAEHASH